jgi:two-component system OmpR family sensor kinase
MNGLLRPRSTRARVLAWLLLGLGVVELGSWQAARQLATAGEPADIAGTLHTEALVSLGGAVLVSMFVWVVAGRVLAPLQELAHTARMVTATDLTSRIPVEGRDELADLARTFNDMLDRLQRTLESQKEFIDDASHELLTPLTIIRGHLELRWEDPAEREATVELVTDEVMRMTRLVDELRVLALTRRPDFLYSEPLDAGAVVREVFEKVRLLASRDWQLASSAGGWLVGDRQRLEQALINLAHNAVQYTGPEDRIVIGAAIDERGARLWVADTGPGVPEDEHARIFERLAYGAGGRRHPNSTGLGLAIVSAIARAHGGRVELNSTPGDGATFSIVIPASEHQGEEDDSGLIREAQPAAVGG